METQADLAGAPPAAAADEPLADVIAADLHSRLGAAIDRGVAAWVAAAVHNSPLSADTGAYNHLVTVALPRLRDAILKEV